MWVDGWVGGLRKEKEVNMWCYVYDVVCVAHASLITPSSSHSIHRATGCRSAANRKHEALGQLVDAVAALSDASFMKRRVVV